MAKLNRDALIVQDMDLARQSLVHEEKKPDERRLAEDIHEDWEILSRSRHLPEAIIRNITDGVVRIIKTHRSLAKKVLPAGVLKKNLDFYRLMLILNATLGQKAESGQISEEDIADIARTKRTIARDIIQPRLVSQVDSDINHIIDSNNDRPLEDIIEQVIAYLKNECVGKNVSGISFYLVNEENYHGQVERLTKTSVGIPSVRMDRRDVENGKEGLELFDNKGEKPRTIHDRQSNKIFYELKINGQQLGLLELDLKPGTELSNIEMQYVRQAMSRLDSKIDEALHSKRLDVIARKAHRVLDEHGTKEHFEEGIAEFMELVCLYSTAYEAEVMVDIFGDGEDWFANKFNDDREITPIEMDSGMKAEVKIPSTSRRVDEKRALVLDIMDSTSNGTEGQQTIIGKVIFRTNKDAEDLTNEDHVLLNLCSEILSSHIVQWRNDLKLRTEGVDPQIARTSMRDGMADIVKETLTVFYTDIAGYTYICEILKEALEDEETTQDIETLRAVLEEFLNLIQKTGQMYGGVWDKAVGDMGLMEFGAPIDQNGKDPLGNDSMSRRPEYFANNGLKAAILVRHKLGEVSRVFRTKLLEIAHKKYSSGLKKIDDISVDEQNALLKKLEEETRLSPKISTTTSVYTGDVGFMRLKLGAAHDWTAIGDAMNSAARVQGTSQKMEIRVPLQTRDLVTPLMNMDAAIPYDNKGGTETWSEFFLNKLGMDPARVEMRFDEYYEGYKNKTGRNVVFTVNLKERSADAIQPNCTMTLEQLLQYEGEEFTIESRRPAEGNMFSFKLKTIPSAGEKAVTFRVNMPHGSIDERAVRYKSPIVLNRANQAGGQNTLLVQDGKLKEFVWKSIEEDQDEQLRSLASELQNSKEKLIIYTKMIPTGCYELSRMTDNQGESSNVLNIRKDNYIFDVQVNNSKIHHGVGPIMKDHEVLYDFQSYYETIRGKVSDDQPVVFVRKRHFYIIDPKEAETYLMPILTRSETTGGGPASLNGKKCSSNPPAAGTSTVPPASTYEKPGVILKTSKFWTKIAEQVSQYQWSGPRMFSDNWNSSFSKPESKE